MTRVTVLRQACRTKGKKRGEERRKKKKKKGGEKGKRISLTLKPKTNIYLAITLERRIKRRKKKEGKRKTKVLGTRKKNAVNNGATI